MSLEDRLYPLLRLYDAAPQPLRRAVGRGYRTLPKAWRYGSRYAEFQREAAAVGDWDGARIGAYQVAAIRESLKAALGAPFYARRFAEAGVSPGGFESLEQLTDYPLLTKQDLLSHREAMVNPGVAASQRLLITTGGSSGVPVGFYLEKGVSRPKEQAYLEAQWMRRGYRVGDRVAVIRGGVTSSRANGAISSYDATRDWLVLSSYHLTPSRLPEYLSELRRFAPDHLHAYPSAALMLMRAMQDGGLKWELPLTSLLCGSEKLTKPAQDLLSGFFGCPVFHWYGHSERVVLAGQGCVDDGLHFWPSYGFVEFGDRTADGLREIIGTSFHNRAMPLIRYRTGDFIKDEVVSGELPAWTTVAEVVGRDYEFLISATGRRISLTAMNMHDAIFEGLMAVQFVQSVPGCVRLRCQPGPAWQGDPAGIRAGVLRKLGDDFEVGIECVAEVEKTSAGKHRWLITSLRD
jgi:phenylacetate-CoA ligase